MRYTGMRISDTALLKASSVHESKIFLYTHKTGVPVQVPIPEFLANELASMRPVGGYAFATPAWPPLIIQFGPPDCQFPAFDARLLWGALAGVKLGFARRADPGETEAGAPQSAGDFTVSSAVPPSFS